MGEVIRYIPLPWEKPLPENRVFENYTGLPGNISGNESIPYVVEYTARTGGADYSYLIPYILLFISFVVLFLVIFSYYIKGGVGRTYTRLYIGRRAVHEGFPEVTYIYSGVKKILRKYFVELRRVFMCKNCTPRELSEKTRLNEVKLFTELYEDVVYGSKARPNIQNIVRGVDKLLASNK
ncbi:MAG: hypothetical protein ABWW65_05495 [Thermoprotei archaeon]